MKPAVVPRGRRRLYQRIVAVAALLLIGLLAWAFASPVGAAPDDDFHIANVYCLHDSSTCRSDDAVWPFGAPWWAPNPADRDPGQYQAVRKVYADLWAYETPRKLPCFVMNESHQFDPQAAVPADCLNAEDQQANRPQSLDKLGYYPTFTYRYLSLFTGDTIRESVAAWRVVGCLTVVLLALGSILLSLPGWRRPLAVSWLVCSVPLGMFLFSSTNPSGLAVAGSVAIVGPAVALCQERATWGLTMAKGLVVLVGALFAAGGRSEGPGYVLAAGLLVLVFGLQGRSRRTQATVIVACGAGLVALVTVAWAAGLLTRVGELAATNFLTTSDAAARQSPWDALVQAPLLLIGTYTTPLGWLDIPMLPPLTVAMALAFWGTVMLGLAWVSPRKLIAVAIIVGGVIAVPVGVAATSGSNVQTRYFLPLVYFAVIATLAPPLQRALPSWGRAQWWGIFAALAVANSVALLTVTVRYVSGLGPGSGNPASLATHPTPTWWWHAWLGPFPNWVVGSLAFAAALALIPQLLVRSEGVGTDADVTAAAEQVDELVSVHGDGVDGGHQ